jgi:tripartite-type tricarboxylate transporter receptor subunit TctC
MKRTKRTIITIFSLFVIIIALFIVTDSPGTPYDGEGRIISSEMTKTFNRPVIVENLVGGGMMMGAMATYRAKPDGYTLAFTSSTSLIMNQLFNEAKYDLTKFTYLGQCTNNSLLPLPVITTSGKGLDTWESLSKLDRPFRWGTVGKGTVTYTAAKALSHVLDLKNPVYISTYSGTELVPAVARGEVDGAVFVMALAEQFIKAGDVKLILFTGNKRVKDYPDVRSFADIGHTELTKLLANYHIVIGPPDLPENISSVLSDAVFKAASTESMKGYQKRAVNKGIGYEAATGDQTRANVMDCLEIIQEMASVIK